MNDAVKQAIVAAEDQTFWTNEGIDFRGVMRAAWNNLTGGDTQGASTITQQYARIAADLKGVTYSRKLREAVIAWKLDDKYSKEEILEFYLNTVPFGRGAYGIEAAAQAFFGKTANTQRAAGRSRSRSPRRWCSSSMVKQPEPDPDDPEGSPGYDPTRSGRGQAELDRAVGLRPRRAWSPSGYLDPGRGRRAGVPGHGAAYDPSSRQSGLDLPTGLVVQPRAERASPDRAVPRQGRRTTSRTAASGSSPPSTSGRRTPPRRPPTSGATRRPRPCGGSRPNWQAALVAVEPGTGRVLAYYGGNDGAGADYAGWYFDEDGEARGFGQHPPGSSFKVYDLAEALRQGDLAAYRVGLPGHQGVPRQRPHPRLAAGPVRNAGTAPVPAELHARGGDGRLAQRPVLRPDREARDAANVIEMARKAGIDYMWANVRGQASPQRVDLRGKSHRGTSTTTFSTEVGIGQYGITVSDHANGMATFAAGGKRAQAHFVREVYEGDDKVYAEQLRPDRHRPQRRTRSTS